MSRAITQDQLTTRSKKLFVTPIMQSDGTIKSVMSAQPLNDQSMRINRAWRGEVWDSYEADGILSILGLKKRKTFRRRKDGDHDQSQRCTNCGALFLLTTLLKNKTFQNQPGVGCSVIAKMNFDIWKNILCFITGSRNHEQIEQVGCYALALQKPVSIFKNAAVYSEDGDPRAYLITDCAIRGEEEIVLNILDADPSYLLKKAAVKNSVDVVYGDFNDPDSGVTPLQAAIMANDIQLIERMKPYFERLTTDLAGNPIDGLLEMKRQMIEIYKKSLRQYFDLTEEKIEKLNTEITTLQTDIAALTQLIATLDKDKYQKPIDWDALREAKATLITKNKALEAAIEAFSTAQKNCAEYLKTLCSDITDPNYLEKLVETHNHTQEHHAFDFTPYVDAICNIDPNDPELQDVLALIDAKTDVETQAAIAKGVSPIEIGFTDQNGRTYTREEVQAIPFNKLTLIQKLNRFREKLVEHMQQEIIFNPNHILEGFKQNEHVWDEVIAGRVSDPNNYAKRAVIFSQLAGWAQRKAAEPVKQDIRQGTLYLTEKNEPRTRQSRFNTWNNSTSSIDRTSLIDVSVSSPGVVDGIGYKFAAARCGAHGMLRWPGMVVGARAGRFQNLCRAKTTSFQNLLRSLCECAPAGLNVVAR